MKRDPSQLDFFQVPVFEARSAVERIDLDRFRARLKRDMARAIRECPYDRPVIAARMAQYLGLASVSKGALDAYAAGHWASFERRKAARPWLRYVCILDDRTRPEHRLRHNLCLPVDHPYWDLWAPPCGWNCRCTLQSLSDRDVDRMRSQLKFEPPANDFINWTNKRTGEIRSIPRGIDPGWDYNPGKVGALAIAQAANDDKREELLKLLRSSA